MMKLNPGKHTEQVNQQEDDLQPQGNPIIILFVLLICLYLIYFLTSSIAQAGEPAPASKGVESSKKMVANWKPPVAPKVSLPDLVDDEMAKEIADKWGIEMISLRLSAAGYMIDFRFRVLDLEKATTFFDHRIKPQLVVERSNAKLPIPMAAKVGAFRTTNRGQNIKSGKIYYMVFGNPDSHAKPGEKVTMEIGGFKARHLTVH